MSETAAGGEVAEAVAELELNSVSERWGWFVALGILMVVLGVIAIGAPLATGIAINLLIGWLLIISGVAHGVHAFRATGWRGALLQVLCGLLYLGVGIMMVTNPVAGLLVLTMTVLAYFIVSGIFKIILAMLVDTLPQRGWVTVSGILSLVLAIYVGSQFPSSALWVIGLLVGIEMMFSGWSFIMLALAARRVRGEREAGPAGGAEVQATV